MINKKRKLEKSRADSPQNAAAIVAPADPKPQGGDTPKPDTAAASLPRPAAASALPAAAKPGPGRPATRAHCLRCAKRVERCACKEGVLLPAEVHRAVDLAKKAEIPALGAEESEQIVRFLVWFLGVAESSAAAMITKLTWDEAEEIYSWSEKDVAAVLPSAHKVLAKHISKLPSWIRDYRDEMQLGMALYQIHKQKISAANELLAKKSAPAPSRPQIVPSASAEIPKAREATQ